MLVEYRSEEDIAVLVDYLSYRYQTIQSHLDGFENLQDALIWDMIDAKTEEIWYIVFYSVDGESIRAFFDAKNDAWTFPA